MKPHKAEDETRVGDVLLPNGHHHPDAAYRRCETSTHRRHQAALASFSSIWVTPDAHSVQLALLRQQALRGQLSQDDNLRLLEEAREKAEAMGNSLSELTAAAEKMGGPQWGVVHCFQRSGRSALAS